MGNGNISSLLKLKLRIREPPRLVQELFTLP